MPKSLNSLALFALFALWLAPLAAFAAEDTPEKTEDKRPNILFIFSDDHGYQAISAYPGAVNKTPNLDRIAKEGMRFDHAYVTNSICGPSRAVVLTGKFSHLNGFVQNGNRFNGEQQTVAKLLQKAGYETAVIGKWHLATTPTGFDYYHVLQGQGPYYNPAMDTPDGVVKHEGYTTNIITEEALDWLKNKRDKTKPFYLMYQHKAPHRNWQPGPDHLTMYDDVEIPEPETLYDDYSGRTSAAKNQTMTVAKHLNANDLKLVPQRGLTSEQRAAWDAAYGPKNKAFEAAKLEGKDLIKWKYQRYAKDYLRCIASVDDNVGRVLDYLEDAGLDENTVVFYTSDQGWYLGEHGWFDKRWMYEESFRTPLMVRWPGVIKPGTTSDAFAMNLDFAETFLDIAGEKIPDDMQGESLVPIFKGETPKDWRTSMYYHYYEFPGAHSVARHYGVRNERYKLIHFYQLDEWELFDLEKDPNELKSVYDDPEYADVKKEMEAELKRLREKYKDDGSVINFRAQKAGETKDALAFSASLDSGTTEMELSGNGAAFSLPSGRAADPSFKPFVVGAKVNPADDNGVIVAHGGASQGYSLFLEGGKVKFALRSNDQLYQVTGPAITRDDWSHVAAGISREGKLELFVDGKVVASTKRKADWIAGLPADGFSIGADSGSFVGEYEDMNPLAGKVDAVRFYDGSLDEKAWQDWLK